jgi:hypothetical protein
VVVVVVVVVVVETNAEIMFGHPSRLSAEPSMGITEG